MKTVKIYVSNQAIEITPGVVLGADLHELVGITSPQQLVISRSEGIDVPISPSDYVIIEGGEKFAFGKGEPPLEDNPCLRKGIKFSLNGEKFTGESTLDKPKLTGAELKALDTNSHQTDGLFVEIKDLADERIQDDWRILVQDKDKFITVPCGNVGEKAPPVIRTFDEQLEEVNKHYSQVDVTVCGQVRLVIIRDIVLPEGWNQKTVDLMIQVPDYYPPTALDMFWVTPHLHLSGGALPERGDQYEIHAGIKWQRFSWHYMRNRWNPVRDSLLSHLRFCINRLNQLK